MPFVPVSRFCSRQTCALDKIGRTHGRHLFSLLLSFLMIQVTNKIMFVIFTCMAVVTTLSLVGYIVFEAEYGEKLYYLCYGIDESPVPLFR